MAVKTLYSALGLETDAGYDDIEAAFTRLRLKYPQSLLDTDEAARIRFQAIRHAHAILKDPDSRAAYDRRISRAGIRTTVTGMPADSGWMAARPVIVLSMVILLVSGMWWYHARQTAAEEAEALQRVLQLAEAEKRRQAELQAQEAARRQALFEMQQQRQQETQERQWQQEARQASRQVDADLRNAQAQAEAQKRRERQDQETRERQQRMERQQAEREAQLRLQREQAELRRICMERYRRPDC